MNQGYGVGWQRRRQSFFFAREFGECNRCTVPAEIGGPPSCYRKGSSSLKKNELCKDFSYLGLVGNRGYII